LKNKLNAVFTFLVTMRDVYEETTKPRHYTYISPVTMQTEIRFVEKSLLKRSPNNNKHSVFAVMWCFSFYSFDRARKGKINKLYKIYIISERFH